MTPHSQSHTATTRSLLKNTFSTLTSLSLHSNGYLYSRRWLSLWLWLSLLELGLGSGVTASIHHKSYPQLSGAEFVQIYLFPWLTSIACQHRPIPTLTSHVLHKSFLMIHLWQLYLSLMAIGTSFSKITMVSFDVWFVLHRTADGARAQTKI